jgi:hypothetical protein
LHTFQVVFSDELVNRFQCLIGSGCDATAAHGDSNLISALCCAGSLAVECLGFGCFQIFDGTNAIHVYLFVV